MNEKLGLKGYLNARLYDEYGNLKHETDKENLVVNAGFDIVNQRLFSTQAGSAAFNYIGIGSISTAAAATDGSLGSELCPRAQGTVTHTDGTKNTSMTTTFAAGTGTGSVQEAGVFNASTGSYMLCRQTFGCIQKGASDSLQITWAFSLS